MSGARDVAATVTPQYGAWLISYEHRPVLQNAVGTGTELYAACSSLRRAKQIAVQEARSWGWTGPARWHRGGERGDWPASVWVLTITWEEEPMA